MRSKRNGKNFCGHIRRFMTLNRKKKTSATILIFFPPDDGLINIFITCQRQITHPYPARRFSRFSSPSSVLVRLSSSSAAPQHSSKRTVSRSSRTVYHSAASRRGHGKIEKIMEKNYRFSPFQESNQGERDVVTTRLSGTVITLQYAVPVNLTWSFFQNGEEYIWTLVNTASAMAVPCPGGNRIAIERIDN